MPEELAGWDIQTIEDRLVDEIENGFGDTGIRPGIIGEIGTTMPMVPTRRRCSAPLPAPTIAPA